MHRYVHVQTEAGKNCAHHGGSAHPGKVSRQPTGMHPSQGLGAALKPWLTTGSEARYGVLLAHYLDDPSNLFVVSSDFCHWGTRFNYTFFDETQVSNSAVLCHALGSSTPLIFSANCAQGTHSQEHRVAGPHWDAHH